MVDLDPEVLKLLEDVEIALVVAERSRAGDATPLADIANKLGIDIDKL